MVAQLKLELCRKDQKKYSSRSSCDDEVDKVVHKETLEEMLSGWAVAFAAW